MFKTDECAVTLQAVITICTSVMASPFTVFDNS